MKSKNVLTAVALTAASFGSACSGGPEAGPSSNAKTHRTTSTTQSKSERMGPSGKEVAGIPYDEIHGLALGDKIELVNVYTPKAGEEKEYILKPSDKYYAEDIGVIYAADLSRLTSENGEVPKEIVCFLISSFEGKIAMSAIRVDRDTHEVLEFSSMEEIEKPGPVYSYRDSDTHLGYSVYLEPSNEGSVKLLFDGISPYGFEQDIEKFQSDQLQTA